MKRFDSSKLFKLASQDVVERFHLLISLLFVLVEEMDNSGNWLPSKPLLWQCSQIFLAELVIDVAKHAVVGKFNEIRPGVYREFMKASFTKASLTKVKLTEVSLTKVRLTEVSLTKVRLTEVSLTKVRLTKVSLTNVILIETVE